MERSRRHGQGGCWALVLISLPWLLAVAHCCFGPVALAQGKTDKTAKKPAKSEKMDKAAKPQKKGAAEPRADEAPSEPATPEAAAKVLDLRALPIPEGAKVLGERRLPWLNYEVEAGVKQAFEFQQKQLAKLGWKELPGTLAEAAYAQARLTKQGYVLLLYVSTNPDDPQRKGSAQVLMTNYGNVPTGKLPAPKGVKPFYSDASMASYLTEAPVADMAKECEKLLLAEGWAKYGTASSDPESPMLYFKKNAIRLMLWVSKAPAQDNQTNIRYSTELLSADLPMPVDQVPDARYDDFNRKVDFDFPGSDYAPVFEFYQKALTDKGWKATTDHPITDDIKKTAFLVFRNDAEDMISLDLAKYTDIVRVKAKHYTKADVDEMDRLAEQQAEKARQELARRNMKIDVALPLPAKAKGLESHDDHSFEFKIATGTAPAAIEELRQSLTSDGWTEDGTPTAERNAGTARFKKEDATLRLSYFDTGVFDAEVSVGGTGVKLTAVAAGTPAERDDSPKTAKSNAKNPGGKKPAGLPIEIDGVEIPDVDELLKDPAKAQDLADKLTKQAQKKQADKKGTKPAAGKGGQPFKIADFPVPEDALGIEYSKITKMIDVASPSDVETLAEFYEQQLTGKGWTKQGDGLVDDDSAILKFEQGEATISIFIDREDGRSDIDVMTKGLAWETVPASRKIPEKGERPAAAGNDPAGPAEKPGVPAGKPKFVAGPKIAPADLKQEHASLVIDKKTIKLGYGVGYQFERDGETLTEVLLTSKPVAVDKIVALLAQGKDAGDAAEFDSQLKLRFDPSGKPTYLFMYAEGLSINRSGSIDDVTAEIELKEGAAQGKAVHKEPAKFFDQTYRIDANFHVKLANRPAGEPGAAAPADETETVATGLVAGEDVDGLPFPLEKNERVSSSSPYRTSVQGVVPASVAAVVEFYRQELPGRGWKENDKAAKISRDEAQLTFQGKTGPLSVKLKKKDEATSIDLAVRSLEKAKAAGILPQANRGRLILGNIGEKQATLTINGKEYKLAAGLGAKDPKDGTSLHVQPGRYNVTIKIPGEADQTEEVNIAVDEAWGVLVGPTGGIIALQLY